MLTNIANRGSLYAIIIQPQHKEKTSVTLNILYGIPAEHRNMPLDDAISLIFRNYQQLCQGENGDVIGDTDDSPYSTIPLATNRHPDSIQHLINLLADNRSLTVLQLDCVMKYLQERRESQYKFELGDSAIDMKSDNKSMSSPNMESTSSSGPAAMDYIPPMVDPEEEIQKRLLEILHKPSIPNIKPETPNPSPEKKHQPSTSNTDASSNRYQEPKLLAKDPNLRNVLDTLMLHDL